VRYEAAVLLADRGDVRGIEALGGLLDSSDMQMRVLAAWVLVRRKNHAAFTVIRKRIDQLLEDTAVLEEFLVPTTSVADSAYRFVTEYLTPAGTLVFKEKDAAGPAAKP
jgi:hypothetical protein